MNRRHALVVDDEALARERIRSLLQAFCPSWRVTECNTAEEAIRLLRAPAPGEEADLVFLDVQMPGPDGFAVLGEVAPDRLPPVVFVTAYDEHAVRAFEVGALDYLLKPVDRRRFKRTIDRVLARETAPGGVRAATRRQLAALLESVERQREGGGQRRFLVRNGDRAIVVRPEAIDWIGSAGNYVELHVGQESHLLRETLTSLEQRLDPRQFLRIHRHTIVNVEAVCQAETRTRGVGPAAAQWGPPVDCARPAPARARVAGGRSVRPDPAIPARAPGFSHQPWPPCARSDHPSWSSRR